MGRRALTPHDSLSCRVSNGVGFHRGRAGRDWLSVSRNILYPVHRGRIAARAEPSHQIWSKMGARHGWLWWDRQGHLPAFGLTRHAHDFVVVVVVVVVVALCLAR